jgi:hypothetical protein
VQTDLTLTVDEDILRAARKAALGRKTFRQQLMRDYLAQLVSESDCHQAALADLDEMFRARPVRIGRPTWTRENLHER